MASILNRLGKAISSGLHDALDKAETPDSIISQLVRESSDNIIRARTLAIEAVASEKRLANDISNHEESVTTWTNAAKLAMENADENAARSALEKKIEAEKMLGILKPQHEKSVSNSQQLKIRLKDLEQSLATLKSKKAAIHARQKGAEALSAADTAANQLKSKTDVDEELSRVEDMVLDLEARNEAVAEIETFTHPEISIDAQQKSDQIEKELAALRKNTTP